MDGLQKPYLLFLGDAPDQPAAKTACGVADWRPEWCVGQFRLPGCQADTGLDDIGIEDAVAKATGIAIEIDGESTQVFRHAFRSSLADEVVKLNLEYRTTTLALAD